VAARKAKARKLRKSNPASDGLLVHGGLAAVIGTVGLVIAFGLVWWQVIAQPQQAARNLEQAHLLDEYSQFFNGRIGELRETLGAMATSPGVVEAMVSYSDAQQVEMEQLLADQHPHIVRVDIIQKGTAEVDLNAEVPISFGALDLIRRAETHEFVGPEVSLNQGARIYAAQPITPDGTVAGVLLVVFENTYFLDPLRHFSRLRGKLEVLQTVGGTPAVPVMVAGGDAGDLAAIEQQLISPPWKLSFTAARSEVAQVDYTNGLFIPFVVSWGVLVAGLFLGFSTYTRRLTADSQVLIEFSTRILRGRSAPAGTYNLVAMHDVAAAIAVYSKQPAATVASEQDDVEEDGDLLAGLEDDLDKEATADDTPTADDFLEVNPSSKHDNFGIEVSEEVGPMEMGINFDPGIFRAYDIRGITTSNLTEDVVYWIGRAFAAEARSKDMPRVVVGRDGRHSGEPLQNSLTKGLTEGGMDVISIGAVPTPTLYYATYALDTGTGIMITGSHNPPEYNGLKMMIAGVTLAEEMIQALYQRLQQNNLSEGTGEVEEVYLDDSYIDKVLEDVAVAQPPKVVVDCGNGIAGSIAPRLLREIGCEVVELYCEVDGDFPNHHPDPAEPENLEDLRTVVQAENADIGLAFDGDGDRLGVVTNSGEIIFPDKLLMLFAQDIVSRNPGADIIYDVKCSRHLNSLISDLGGRPIMWKTGHSHMKAKIKETGALLAGEFSGHICFGERWYGFDDALYSAVRLLEILGSESRTADEVFAQFPVTFSTPEIKITTTEAEKFEIMEQLEQQADFGEGTITSIDGIRVDFADGWGLIRPSNTSPVLSLRFEADNAEALDRIQDEFQVQLSKVDAGLTIR
jgi:phosphomannomutase/phosphoglucomutase